MWIHHKRRALQWVVDRYGAYMNHLQALTEDSSVKVEDRACIKGYLKKWMQYRQEYIREYLTQCIAV